jgi:hypothetical protein
MNKLLFNFIGFTAAVLMFSSCKETPETPPLLTGTDYQNGVYVINEGGFGNGNASLSYIHSDGDTLVNQLYDSKTDLPLGDVGQSMNAFGGKGYIVLNNSAKIEVVDLADFSSVGTINDLGSPRFIEFVSETKAYVTDLFAGVIHIVNPTTMAKTGGIPVNGWVEEMRTLNGFVYAVGNGSGNLYKINPASDLIVDSVMVGTEPYSLEIDANEKIWCLASGGWQAAIPNLVRIDPTTMTVEADLAFNTVDESPSDLSVSMDGQTLYFLNNGAFSMGISATSIPTSAMISAGMNYFYKMDVDPSTGDIYVSDPVDFSQNGKVYKHNSSGTLVRTYDMSVAPGGYHFVSM